MAGVVADGPVRDIDEAIGYDFPIFSRSLTSFTARGRVVEKGTNVPVRDRHVPKCRRATTCSPTAAPSSSSPRATSSACSTPPKTIVAKEAAMAKAILAGTPIGEVMGGNYEHMLKG